MSSLLQARAAGRLVIWAVAAVLILTTSPNSPNAAETKNPASSDEDTLRAAVDSYVAAYNRGDAKAVADLWADNAEWVSPSGDRYQGRQAIEREMEVLFSDNKGMKIEVIKPTIRLIAPDAALEEGTVRVIRPGEPPDDATYLAVYSKNAGQWKLESVRETAVPEVQSPHDQLKPLEWLVGEWVDESPDVVVEHQCRWSEDGKFLLGQFVVQWQGKPAMKGDIRIGWDPLRKQIRSWIFDSEGGFAEGLWTQVGEGWVVKMTGVRPDGSTASSTNIYKPLRRDEYQYTSADRIVGGEYEPDQTVTIVRKPPPAKSP